MSDFYRLVYASKNMLQGTDADVSAAVTQILETSQRNNAEVGVTGALMFNGGAFAQVLEGPRLGVETTFERIQRDERHGDVTVLQCGPVTARGFTNWSMAFVGQSARGLSLWSRLAAESGFDIARMDGDAVFAMLHDLVLEEEGMSSAKDAGQTAGAIGSSSAQPTRLNQPVRIAVPSDPGQTARSAVAASRPPQSDPAEAAHTASDSGTEAILAIVKLALSDERQRTTELRTEVDELRVRLAVERQRLEAMCKERDLWAKRAGLLASCISGEAGNATDFGSRSEKGGAANHAQPQAGPERSLKSVA